MIRKIKRYLARFKRINELPDFWTWYARREKIKLCAKKIEEIRNRFEKSNYIMQPRDANDLLIIARTQQIILTTKNND